LTPRPAGTIADDEEAELLQLEAELLRRDDVELAATQPPWTKLQDVCHSGMSRPSVSVRQ
jgi:hypothetical protein